MLEFAESREAWNREKERLERYHDHWRKYLNEWRAKQHDSVKIHEVELYQRYMIRLREEIRRQAEVVKECMAIMEQKREVLLTAQKDRKIMEKLQEYHRAAYEREQHAQETKLLDEAATQRFNWKQFS